MDCTKDPDGSQKKYHAANIARKRAQREAEGGNVVNNNTRGAGIYLNIGPGNLVTGTQPTHDAYSVRTDGTWTQLPNLIQLLTQAGLNVVATPQATAAPSADGAAAQNAQTAQTAQQNEHGPGALNQTAPLNQQAPQATAPSLADGAAAQTAQQNEHGPGALNQTAPLNQQAPGASTRAKVTDENDWDDDESNEQERENH